MNFLEEKFTRDGKYKKIVKKAKMIDQKFKKFQGNKTNDIKYKEKFNELIQRLQNPNDNDPDYDSTKLLKEVRLYLKALKNNNEYSVNELENDIKELCIDIGNFINKTDIEAKHAELNKLKEEEIALMEDVMKLIDDKFDRTKKDENPFGKKILNQDDAQIIKKEIKQQQEDNVLRVLYDSFKSLGYATKDIEKNINKSDISRILKNKLNAIKQSKIVTSTPIINRNSTPISSSYTSLKDSSQRYKNLLNSRTSEILKRYADKGKQQTTKDPDEIQKERRQRKKIEREEREKIQEEERRQRKKIEREEREKIQEEERRQRKKREREEREKIQKEKRRRGEENQDVNPWSGMFSRENDGRRKRRRSYDTSEETSDNESSNKIKLSPIAIKKSKYPDSKYGKITPYVIDESMFGNFKRK
jgi:hypothetical protein